MSIKGLAILNAYVVSSGPIHFYERMAEEFNKLSLTLDLAKSDEVMAVLTSEGNLENRLGHYDFILYLDKDLYLSIMLEKAGYRLFDTARSIELCDDKMLTHIALSGYGIKMPKTISGPLNYTGARTDEFLDRVEKELTYPFVMKSNYGSLGKEVRLINNRAELAENEKRLLFSPRLYQEFIASSFGVDNRLILIGGKVVACMKRRNLTGDFRSNLAQGGIGEKVELPISYIETAQKAAVILGLDYCGVDLLDGQDGEPVLCEVNSNAFITGVEKVTGINVAGAYAKHIIKSLS